MTTYKITAEFPNKGPLVLTENRKTAKSRIGQERQLKNVVEKYELYSECYGYTGLEVERVTD